MNKLLNKIFLSRITSLITFFLLLSLTACTTFNNAEKKATAILNVAAIDAVNGVRESIGVLILDGGGIAMVGNIEAGDFGGIKRDNLTIIDGSGKYLIPGLWDAHVHLSYTPGLDHETFFPLSIAHGVTSLRDTGGHLSLLAPARAAARLDPCSPDLYVSGPLLDGENRVYDGHSKSFPDLSVGLATPQQAREKVDELAAAGVDFVKAYEMLKPDVFAAIIDQASKHNLPIAAHTPLSMTASQAAMTGASDMQHLRNLELSCTSDTSGLLGKRQELLKSNQAPTAGALRSDIHKQQRASAIADQNDVACNELINTLHENNVYQTPTLTIARFMTRRLYAEQYWQDTFKLVPPAIGEGWLARATKLSESQPDQAAMAFDAWVISMVSRLQSSNVPIMAGTDAPIGYLTPGASLHQELMLLVDAGLTPMQALQAATLTPAEFFGLANQQGSIDAGMKADLVLLNANPLEDIRNTQSIEAVIKNGHYLNQKELLRLRSLPATLDTRN